MALRELTIAEITAAKLRQTAHELLMQADALEASVVKHLPKVKDDGLFRNPITGRKSKIKKVDIGL